MAERPGPDPVGERWAPVGEVLPVFIGLARASGRELGIIWALMVAGILALSAVWTAIGWQRPGFLGLTPAILPVAFGTAMAAHRMLWPRAPSLAECADVAMRAFPYVLAVLAIRQVAMTLGFSLLVLPGLAAAVFFLLAPVVVMAEGPGIRTAMIRSARLVLPVSWAVLALLFIAALGGLVLLVPIAILAVPLSLFGETVLQHIVEAGAIAAFPLTFTTMGTAIYLHVTAAGETRH